MYDAPIRDGNGSLHPLLHHLIAKSNSFMARVSEIANGALRPALVPAFA